jgi:hypothetical protein
MEMGTPHSPGPGPFSNRSRCTGRKSKSRAIRGSAGFKTQLCLTPSAHPAVV